MLIILYIQYIRFVRMPRILCVYLCVSMVCVQFGFNNFVFKQNLNK